MLQDTTYSGHWSQGNTPIYFKQTLVKEQESQKEALRVLKDSSSKKEDHLRKTGSSRLPVEYSLVSFLGSKLKKLWKISIHWLILLCQIHVLDFY